MRALRSDHAERIAGLNDETIFLPDDYIRYTLFPWILLTVSVPFAHLHTSVSIRR
jgi:hypothetical protein